MEKTTKIAGIDNKYGRKSRTGSTISMNITDLDAMACQQYLMAIESGEEPTGRIKRIELVMYSESDMVELETIEALKDKIKEMQDFIDNLDTVVKSAEMLEEAIDNPDPIEIVITDEPKEEIIIPVVPVEDVTILLDAEKLPSNQPNLKLGDV